MEINQENCEVIVKSETINRSNSGMITGVVYFDLKDYQFPEADWNDSVVVVLGWWINELTKLSQNLTNTVMLRFMDGPLLIRINKKNDTEFTLECIDRSKSSEPEYSKNVSAEGLLSNLISVGNSICAICEARNWHSEDVTQLREIIAA